MIQIAFFISLSIVNKKREKNPYIYNYYYNYYA